MKTLSENLEAVDDSVQEKYLTIILISTLPEELNYSITPLESKGKERLTWEYVRHRLMHKADKMEKFKHLSDRIVKSDHTSGAARSKTKGKLARKRLVSMVKTWPFRSWLEQKEG